MKRIITILSLSLISLISVAQDKKSSVSYNSLIEVKGTEFVVARANHWSKRGGSTNHILFVNTRTGARRQVEVPLLTYSDNVEQVRIEKLGVNLVLLGVRVVDLNGKNGVDYGDPRQLIAFSPDGEKRTQITEDRFFLGSWTVNSETGRIVITGRYDSNGNGKQDFSDQSQILLFDLTTMKPVSAS